MKHIVKPELLAPAGDLEKLKTAIIYGADAVYVAGERYGLRAKAKNFTNAQMEEGIKFAHSYGGLVYVAANIYAHNDDLEGFGDYVCLLREMGADALVISDLGLFHIAKEAAPDLELHISTQANITNLKSAQVWHSLGAKRLVLARELSFKEIKEIRNGLPQDVMLECFIHGAICLSYSGRCYLSQYIHERDANRGSCSQPCRWGYALMEEKREGEYFPVYEDERGSYILNSKDMRMVEHLPEIFDSGIGSLKIEGRMKTSYYVASTVKAYRMAIDDYLISPELYKENIPKYKAETEKTSHRKYFTGFYFNNNKDKAHNSQSHDGDSYVRGYDFKAVVKDYDKETGFAVIEQRNKFQIGDELETLSQEGSEFSFTVTEMYNENGDEITSAPHPNQIIKIKVPQKVSKYNMFRHAQS